MFLVSSSTRICSEFQSFPRVTLVVIICLYFKKSILCLFQSLAYILFILVVICTAVHAWAPELTHANERVLTSVSSPCTWSLLALINLLPHHPLISKRAVAHALVICRCHTSHFKAALTYRVALVRAVAFRAVSTLLLMCPATPGYALYTTAAVPCIPLLACPVACTAGMLCKTLLMCHCQKPQSSNGADITASCQLLPM